MWLNKFLIFNDKYGQQAESWNEPNLEQIPQWQDWDGLAKLVLQHLQSKMQKLFLWKQKIVWKFNIHLQSLRNCDWKSFSGLFKEDVIYLFQNKFFV